MALAAAQSAAVPRPYATPLALVLAGACLIWLYELLVLSSLPANWAFLFCLAAAFFTSRPRMIGSPLLFLIAFYLVFYGLGSFGSRYTALNFRHEDVIHVYRMAIATLAVGTIVLGSLEPAGVAKPRRSRVLFLPPSVMLLGMLAALLALALVFMQKTGGIAQWIANPGRTFIGREGAGVEYVAFNYAFYALSGMLGIHAAMRRTYWPILLALVLTITLSPFLGSKQKLALAMLLAVAPLIYWRPAVSRATIALGIAGAIAIVSINAYRNITWLELRHWSPWCCGEQADQTQAARSGTIRFDYATAVDVTNQSFWAYNLNYFDVVENAVIAVQDFQERQLSTIALPFRKLAQLTGARVEPYEFDMSFYLTSVYYPWIVDLKASTQWPVETDLYLTFGYPTGWFIAPFLALMFAAFAIPHRLAGATGLHAFKPLGMFVNLYMFTHLRGGVVYWTDFYVVPVMLILLGIWLLYELSLAER